MFGAKELSEYEEQYGSKAKFAVMCPHTAYWQQTIAEVVRELTADYGTDGVYIDQIAAAGPRSAHHPPLSKTAVCYYALVSVLEEGTDWMHR